MKPTEHEATVAVDAAARAAFAAVSDNLPEAHRIGFDDLDPIWANSWRERVLPLVWAALEALPDRAHAALVQAADVCCTCHLADAPHEDWCVSVGILQMMELLDGCEHLDEAHDD